jgi:hypothetical protein
MQLKELGSISLTVPGIDAAAGAGAGAYITWTDNRGILSKLDVAVKTRHKLKVKLISMDLI